MLLRAIPLMPGTERGTLVLARDATELRRREAQLLSKDATIREIHHRVKNNLQTVAALLRLQARRMVVPEARMALRESVRRVTSIALVHETLSQSMGEEVDFDVVADQLAAMTVDVAATGSRATVRAAGRVRHPARHACDPARAGALRAACRTRSSTGRPARSGCR